MIFKKKYAHKFSEIADFVFQSGIEENYIFLFGPFCEQANKYRGRSYFAVYFESEIYRLENFHP